MALNTITRAVLREDLPKVLQAFLNKIKSTFQTLGNLVTAWGSAPSDSKYPSEKLVKDSLDGKVSVSDVKNASWGVNILRQSFQAKNGTTVDNTNKTITATYDTSKSTDIYCYATTSVPIVLGETYTISFDVIESNLTEGQYWEWGFFGQGHAVFRITGTGHYSKTLVSDINRSVGYSALIDDGGKSLSNGSYIVMKNIKYEIGPFETKYSDFDSLLVTGSNALSTTLGPMIRALGSWSKPAEGEFIPAASGSSQGRYTLRKIFDFFKSLMVSDSGVNISGNAGTATTAAGYTSGGAIDTALQEKATPADIASAIQALDVASQGGDGKYIKAISEADGKISATAETMDTTPTASSTKAVTSGGVKTALDGKQDDLGISSSGDAGKFLNEKGEWATPTGTEQVNADWDATSGKAEILHKPTVSRYFNKYSGGTSVYGWKIGSTVTRNIEGVSSIITGVFTLALGIRVENAPQESTAVKTMATMVGFFSCYARYESGANVVKARIYTPVSSIFDATYNIKYIDEGNGKFTWVLGFGTGTTPISKEFVHCSVNVMSSINADFENFGDAITSAPTYPSGAYFTVFKSPVIGQNTSGVGDATKPVYADTNGFIKECTSVNADTVDGFHFSTSTSGSATNTVYLV